MAMNFLEFFDESVGNLLRDSSCACKMLQDAETQIRRLKDNAQHVLDSAPQSSEEREALERLIELVMLAQDKTLHASHALEEACVRLGDAADDWETQQTYLRILFASHEGGFDR